MRLFSLFLHLLWSTHAYGSPKPLKLPEIAEMAECLRRGLGRPLNLEEMDFFIQAEHDIQAEETALKVPSRAA